MREEMFRQSYYQAVSKHEHGFYELKKSYVKNMQEFYENDYFQNESACYRKTEYDPIDLEYKKHYFAQKVMVLNRVSAGIGQLDRKRFLDIGCGEGFALSYFHDAGWDVTGIDLTTYALELHNPDMKSYVMQADLTEAIEALASKGITFDFLNADNLLEHIPDPQMLLKNLRRLCRKESVICINVPNDFSIIQSLADQMGQIDSPFWVTEKTCEHINYFSLDSLAKLGESLGYEKVFATADWPIDFFLLNPSSNYRKKRELGHDCHVACAMLENELSRQSMENTLALHAAIAACGLGRAVSVYFKPRLDLTEKIV